MEYSRGPVMWDSEKQLFKADVGQENIGYYTDTHLSYQGLDQEFAGHGTVNHSQDEYRNGIYYTNSVEGFFSLFKRTIFGTYHQISPKHLHRYCSETSYRFNSRKIKDKERFNRLLSHTEGRLTYNELINKQKSKI